eukprot:jgi/Tetstr1/459385/TSEL_004764.t1
MWLRLAEGLLPAYDQPQQAKRRQTNRRRHQQTSWHSLECTTTTPSRQTLLRVGDGSLCAISLGQEDEEIADTLRLAVALTSPIALLRAIRLRIIYLTESEFDPSELPIHPFSQTIREAGELGGNTSHNQIRSAAISLRKKARKTAPTPLALRATGRPIYTLTLQLTAHYHSVIGGTRSTDRTEQ